MQHDGVNLPLETIGNYVALHDPDFHDLNFNALNRILVGVLGKLLDVQVSDEDIEAECVRFRKKKDLVDELALSSWLEANDLSYEEFQNLMAEVATCRRMHRWFLIARWMDRTTKTILDDLRLQGRYVEWAQRAAAQEDLLDMRFSDRRHAEVAQTPLKDLFAEHWEWMGSDDEIDVSIWAEEAGFHTEGNLRMELNRARLARQALLELLARGVGADGISE